MADLLPVVFHGDTLYLVEIEGEPFTPARPICEAIGVSWSGQHSKLTSAAHRWGCADICIPTLGGEQQTLCIPVRKLSGWLANISAAKVKPEIREKLIAYQDECDDALWRYWTEGHASRPGTPVQGNLALLPPLARPRGANLAKIGPYGWDGERVAAARLQLETASGILAGVEFARDDAMVLDLLTAAHAQCQIATLFIVNHYDEVNGHAA